MFGRTQNSCGNTHLQLMFPQLFSPSKTSTSITTCIILWKHRKCFLFFFFERYPESNLKLKLCAVMRSIIFICILFLCSKSVSLHFERPEILTFHFSVNFHPRLPYLHVYFWTPPHRSLKQTITSSVGIV